VLDGQPKFRHPLHLVDQQQPIVPNESHRIGARGRSGDRVVQEPGYAAPGLTEHELSESALADLACAVQHKQREYRSGRR
jgi:hypothetical protein